MTVRVGVDDDGGRPGAGASGAAGAGAGGWFWLSGWSMSDVQDGWQGLGVELDLRVDIARAAGFKEVPVLARGIVDGLACIESEDLDYRQAVNLLDEASRL
ncbi:hypothetical protein, partial [Arthrobacter castelli]|uniref:hypothetical protein n=1 Tax=Arthrobacter castelli TaxID=271431 RepID=UPI0012DF362F